MKVAALDLGSNTFLCLLAEGNSSGVTKIHKDLVEVVRLGQGVGETKSFHPEALTRARNCLTNFKKEIDAFKPDKILAVATSAARDAKNGDELFKIGRDLQIPIEIIEGSEEAEISFGGALVGFNTKDIPVGVIDIGGGSTEIISGLNGKILSAKSLNIGGVRLTEKFISAQPVPESDQTKLKEYILDELKKFDQEVLSGKSTLFANFPGAAELFAVAGTPTSLAAIEIGQFIPEKVDGFKFDLNLLEKWQKIFASTSVEEKKQRYNLGGRADIIYVGTTILLEFMKYFGFKELTVSTKGVRYGVALHLFTEN
jgi:exopolyphosphatase/guanosine-5'-triphosphate,3'-diphosphate pyrophosphatase